MTDNETKALTQLATSYNAMRKYQKRFFNGDKSAIKMAIYHENQTDNYISRMIADNQLKLPEIKGESTQGSLM